MPRIPKGARECNLLECPGEQLRFRNPHTPGITGGIVDIELLGDLTYHRVSRFELAHCLSKWCLFEALSVPMCSKAGLSVWPWEMLLCQDELSLSRKKPRRSLLRI